MHRLPVLLLGLILLPVSLWGCGESDGGGGDGGSDAQQVACAGNADCGSVTCACGGGESTLTIGGACEATGPGEGKRCVSAAEVCERASCTESSGAGGASTGTATSGGSTAAAGGSGAVASASNATSISSTGSGPGPAMHPECIVYADAHCGCGIGGECAPDFHQEIVELCDSLFDTPFMQCALGCVAAGMPCDETGLCENDCG